MAGFYYDDLKQFEQDLEKAIAALGSGKVRDVLEGAMKPIEEAATRNAPRKSGAMKTAIKTYARLQAGTVFRVTTGVHRQDWPVGADGHYYPAYVEYGHGGPQPALPHPWLRPAFDANKDEVFQAVGEGIAQLLKENGL